MDRKFLEAWFSTDTSINRHIELDRSYLPLRIRSLEKRQNAASFVYFWMITVITQKLTCMSPLTEN